MAVVVSGGSGQRGVEDVLPPPPWWTRIMRILPERESGDTTKHVRMYGHSRGFSTVRGGLVCSSHRCINARLSWRRYTQRQFDDNIPEGHGRFLLGRICTSAYGHLNSWIGKERCKPWLPRDRWGCPLLKALKDMLESQWRCWVSSIGDDIEQQGQT